MKKITDCNLTLFRWPFRRLPGDQTVEILTKLRNYGFQEAWASSFEGLFHKDIAAVNARLAEECRNRGKGILVPFGVVNPAFPDWEEDLRRCHEDHGMPGIRVFPSYHGYDLRSPPFDRLLRMAAQLGFIVQLPVLLEDPRTQHPLFQVPETDLRPLLELLPNHPDLELVLLNYRPSEGRVELLRRLMETGNVYADISNVEAAGGVGELLEKVAVQQVLFGSHAPFFVHEAALLKIQESALSPHQRESLLSGNPRRLLARTRGRRKSDSSPIGVMAGKGL